MVDRTSEHRRRPAIRDSSPRGWPSTNRGRESPGRPDPKPAPSPAPDRVRLPAPRDRRRPPATWRAPEPRPLRAKARTAGGRPRERTHARAPRPAPPAPEPPLRVPARQPTPAAPSCQSQPAPRPTAPRPPPQRNPRAVHQCAELRSRSSNPPIPEIYRELDALPDREAFMPPVPRNGDATRKLRDDPSRQHAADRRT